MQHTVIGEEDDLQNKLKMSVEEKCIKHLLRVARSEQHRDQHTNRAQNFADLNRLHGRGVRSGRGGVDDGSSGRLSGKDGAPTGGLQADGGGRGGAGDGDYVD